MKLQKIIIKIPIVTKDVATPDRFFKVWNTWIPNSPEIFVDVLDYQHTHDGPLTVLVGYRADFVLDNTDSELGLMYRERQKREGSNREKIVFAFKTILKACSRLESEKEFYEKLKFDDSTIIFSINDRAIAPNTKKTFEWIQHDLHSAIEECFGKAPSSLKPSFSNPSSRFCVRILK